MSIRICSHTHTSFCEAMTALLGKGRIHAGLLYEEFFRTGRMLGASPAFANAQVLLANMLRHIEFIPPVVNCEQREGETSKMLLQLHDGKLVESVIIPMKSGGTQCVSSQVGCRMGCTFCETGKMGLLRNLSTEEIISQVFMAKHIWGCSIRNVVFMGMGEPFDNYDNVMQAVRILCDPKGFGFGPRHITVSTSGCIDGIERLMQEGAFAPNLAVSVNASCDEERNKLMPINRRHDMAALHKTMQEYCRVTGRQILAAYVLLADKNDTLEHADRLAAYLKGVNVKVNLIPYNPQTRDRFAAPKQEVIDAFALRLREHGYRTLLRGTKGQGIMAACGQLGKKQKKSLVVVDSDPQKNSR